VVASLRVQHFAVRGETADARGEIGTRSFAARFGDQVRVTVEPSEPAYCFLLALNPNGREQLCWPRDEKTPPERVERLEFPEAGFAFTLDDEEHGGLQAFVVVASRRPLPAYAAWREGGPGLPWERLPVVPGLVWRGDGERLDPVLAGRDNRGTIGELKGVAPLAEAVRRLRSAEGVEAVSVVAFPVLPRP
jgi:hypothetical protein